MTEEQKKAIERLEAYLKSKTDIDMLDDIMRKQKYITKDQIRKNLDIYKNIENQLPFLEIPENVIMKPISPFGGAIFRCHFALKSNPEISLSVYLGAYNALGSVGSPYWEIHPNKSGDCSRFLIHQTKEMMNEVIEILEFLDKPEQYINIWQKK